MLPEGKSRGQHVRLVGLFVSKSYIYIWKNINELITITYKRRNEVKNVGRYSLEFSWFRFLLWWSVG